MKKGIFAFLLALLLAAGCSVTPNPNKPGGEAPQAQTITVTATPASVRSKPAIVVGVRNAASAIGWDGYAFVVESRRVVLYSAGTELTELANRRCEGTRTKAPIDLRVDIEGSVIRCYVLDDAPGVEPWPEIELNIELPAAYEVECLDLAGKDAKFENLQLTPYTPKTYENTYLNPVYDSLADPDVVYEDGTFYLYGTGGMGYGVHTSTDLVNWGRRGSAVYGTLWGITPNYWAPDLDYVDGKWWMAVTCDEKLGFATSEDLMGPFTAVGEKPFYDPAIDGHIFQDDDGRRYLYYVSWKAGPNSIYGVELDENMQPIESTARLIVKPTEDWEKTAGSVTEGPFMLKHNGLYYLTYSGSGFTGIYYAVGYAVSESPLGHFEKYEHNPILVGNSQIHGVGHHGCVTIPETGEMWMVYHCHFSLTQVSERKICIDRMRFSPVEGDIDRLEVYGPTVTPQPYPELGKK